MDEEDLSATALLLGGGGGGDVQRKVYSKLNALEQYMAVPKLRGGRGGVANAEGDALAVT